MKKLVTVAAVLIITAIKIKSSKIKNIQYIPQENSSKSLTTAAAQGDYAATTSKVSVQATTGNSSIGIGGAQAKTDSVKTDSGVIAVAVADQNTKLATSDAYQETTAQKSYGQLYNANLNTIDKTSYLKENQKLFLNDKSVLSNDNNAFKLGQDKVLTNNRQIIKDNSVDLSRIQNGSEGVNQYQNDFKQEVVITVNSGDEKVIIEKIISRDERVIIVNAAKYLKNNLAQSEIDYINLLKKGSCNCKQVKDYVIEMLAESS